MSGMMPFAAHSTYVALSFVFASFAAKENNGLDGKAATLLTIDERGRVGGGVVARRVGGDGVYYRREGEAGALSVHDFVVPL